MQVNRHILELKTNEQLEVYLQAESRAVPDAKRMAFEILQSRGKEFTEEEQTRILSQIEQEEKIDEIIIHPNHIKASNLIWMVFGLGLLILIPTYQPTWTGEDYFYIFVSLAVTAFIATYIRKGSNNIKYILLVTMIIGFFFYTWITLLSIFLFPLVGFIRIVQTALEIWAIVLLFQIPKQNKDLQEKAQINNKQ